MKKVKQAATQIRKGKQTSHWIHIEGFLNKQEADALYDKAASFPWATDGKEGDGKEAKEAAYFGKSYPAPGGKPRIEHETDPALLPLAERVAEAAHWSVNYVQCHRMAPDAIVRPHRDPAGIVVPMLTLGQARTFRVGGTIPQHQRQSQRPLEAHAFDEEIVMNHGDLLIFTGGAVAHSMVAAKDDPNFAPNGFDHRVSVLFRYTTDAMRQHGPGKKAREAGHDEQYKAGRLTINVQDVLAEDVIKSVEGFDSNKEALRGRVTALREAFNGLKPGESIKGCTRWTGKGGFCQKVLKRTERAIQYMLGGGNKNRKKKDSDAKHVSRAKQQLEIARTMLGVISEKPSGAAWSKLRELAREFRALDKPAQKEPAGRNEKPGGEEAVNVHQAKPAKALAVAAGTVPTFRDDEVLVPDNAPSPGWARESLTTTEADSQSR